MLWVQCWHFCWELAETTEVFFVFLSSSVHFLRLLGHHHLRNALVLKRLGNFFIALSSHFLQAHFIFGEASNYMKEQQFERGPRVACGCVLAVGREAALWACDTAVCYGLH